MNMTLVRTTPEIDRKIGAQIRHSERRDKALLLAHMHGAHTRRRAIHCEYCRKEMRNAK